MTAVVGAPATIIDTTVGHVDIFTHGSVTFRGPGFQFNVSGGEVDHLIQVLSDDVSGEWLSYENHHKEVKEAERIGEDYGREQERDDVIGYVQEVLLLARDSDIEERESAYYEALKAISVGDW